MFEFTEEYEPLWREVREIAEKVVKPRTKEIEESDEFPADMANRFFKEGYLQIMKLSIFSEKWKGMRNENELTKQIKMCIEKLTSRLSGRLLMRFEREL